MYTWNCNMFIFDYIRVISTINIGSKMNKIKVYDKS
jgi:hypothetical protein